VSQVRPTELGRPPRARGTVRMIDGPERLPNVPLAGRGTEDPVSITWRPVTET